MALDPTARKANVKDSLKRFFIDTVKTIEGVQVTFDRGLGIPKVQGSEVDKWVSVNLGNIEPKTFSRMDLRVFCCTRRDNEGYKLAQLRDTILGHLTDSSKTDNMKRITFYRTTPTSWTPIGTLLVQNVTEDGEGETEDETKFVLLSVTIMWPSVI